MHDERSPTFSNLDCGRIPFTGRFKERDWIKNAFKANIRVIQVNGPAFVGKARLLQQCLGELIEECGPQENISVLRLTLGSATSYSLPDVPQTYESVRGSKKIFVFLFVKCETCFDNEDNHRTFVNHCNHLLREYDNTVICMSSQTTIRLGEEFKEFSHCLEGLELDDARQLLHLTAGSVPGLEEHADKIAQICCCFPKIILRFGKFLEKYKFVKPSELVTGLADRILADIIATDESTGLSMVFRDILSNSLRQLRVFSGSFTTHSAKKVMDYRSDVEVKLCLKELQDRSLVLHDEVSDRVRLHTFVGFMSNILRAPGPCLETKKKHVGMCGDLLVWMNSEVYEKGGHGAISGYLYAEEENIKNVLQQCVIPYAELYPLFFEIATKTDELLVPRFQMHALEFYENMLDAAEMFQKTEHVNILRAFYGKALTRLGCVPYKVAMKEMKDVEPDIRKSKDSFQKKVLFAAMGYNYQKQGENVIALRYFSESSQIHLDSRIGTSMEKLNKSREIIAKIFLGLYDCAREDLETLMEKLHKPHPLTPVLINALGLIYQRSQKNTDKALVLYKNSAVERYKFTHMDPTLPVVPECNIGKLLSSKYGQHEEGLEHVKRALEICKRTENRSYLRALSLWYYGEILMNMEKYEEAIKYLCEAKGIINKVDFHVAFVDVSYHLAKCYVHLGNEYEAKYVLQCALKLKKKYNDNTPTGLLSLQILEMLVELDPNNVNKWYPELITELIRLREIMKQEQSFERSRQFNHEIFRYSHQWCNIEECIKAYRYEIESHPNTPMIQFTEMQTQILELNPQCSRKWFETRKNLERNISDLKRKFHDSRYTLCCNLLNLIREAFSKALENANDRPLITDSLLPSC